jgi:hypothetical protein
MGRKRAMSLIRVYLLAKTFVFRNEHFQLVFKLKTILLKIRALDPDSAPDPDPSIIKHKL